MYVFGNEISSTCLQFELTLTVAVRSLRVGTLKLISAVYSIL